MHDIMGRPKGIVVAADVERERLNELVRHTCMVEGILGYKIGLQLALEDGLIRISSQMKDITDLPIIYDHQKAGNDIPEMGRNFAAVCKRAGVDAVILFPFAGPRTERDWIKAAQDQGLGVIVGGHMTHPQFELSDGGFVSDGQIEQIYRIAAIEGVSNFVVPGTKPQMVQHYKEVLDDIMGPGNYALYSPGFVAQGGNITEAGRAAGEIFYPIVGRHIYSAEDMQAAAEQMASQLI